MGVWPNRQLANMGTEPKQANVQNKKKWLNGHIAKTGKMATQKVNVQNR